MNVGLRAGGVLSPILFAIIFAAVLKKVKSSLFWTGNKASSFTNRFIFSIAYADDLALLSQTIFVLNGAVGELERELVKYGMKISVNKTKAYSFWPKRVSPFTRSSVFIYGQAFEWVSEFRYLGVLFHESGDLKKHFALVSGRARVALGLTVKLIEKLGIADSTRLRRFFVSFVAAQLYGFQLLGGNVAVELDTMKRDFFRGVFRLHRFFPHWVIDLFFDIEPGCVIVLRG